MFWKRFFIFIAAVCLTAPLAADDAKDAGTIAEGLEKLKKLDYVDAASLFARAESEADSPDLKYKAAVREAECYRFAGYRGKEFDALEKLISNYPTRINYAELVDREFAIGDAYFHGYADPAFWSLRFIPWLTDRNRMQEIYEAAIKHAHYAPGGANARLRLAVRALENAENEKALKLLREIIQIYPGTETARYAMLELGNALSQMALAGDGDGKNFNEAMAVFSEFRAQYPDLSENEWVNQCEINARNAYANRLHNIAKFYYREGYNESATTYLLEVMRRFPDTQSAIESEKLLTKLDKSYFPEKIEPAIPANYPQYEMLKFPGEKGKLLIAPENSRGKFLLPVYDLNLPKEKK